jgi:hypothetical protein
MNANRKNSFKAVTAIVVAFFLALSVSPTIANTSSVPVSASKSKSTNTIVVSTHKVLVSSGVAKVALTVSPARVGSLSTLTVSPIKGSTIVPSTWTLSFNRPVLFLNKKVSTISSVGAKINIKIGFIDTRNIIVTYKGVDNKGKIVSTRSLVKVASINGSTGSPTVIDNPIVKPTVSPFVSSGADSGATKIAPTPTVAPSTGIIGVTIPQTTWGSNLPLVLPPADWKASWSGYIAPTVTDVSILSCKWNPSPVDRDGNILSTTPGDGAFDVIVKYGLTGGVFRQVSKINSKGQKFITDYSPKDISYNTTEFYIVQQNSVMNLADRTEQTFGYEVYFAPMNWNKNLYLVGENQDILSNNSLAFNGYAPLPIPEGVCK